MNLLLTETAWSEALTYIRPRISRSGFENWFQGIEFLSDDGSEIVLTVPNSIHQFFLESNYLPLIRSAIELQPGMTARKLRIIAPTSAAEEASTVSSAPAPTPAPAKTRPTRVVSAAECGLNEGNTFDSFVIGPNNQLSYSAAQAVAEKPGRAYNPLLFYGKSGLGKTHLLHAIGHQVLANRPNTKIVYTTSEQFTNEFIDAVQHRTLDKFRRHYRQIDVLMIDDVQFFADKNSTQEEFFHTFSSIHNAHKQIILSSDRPPNEIASLDERLVSRFVWGMTTELLAPDTEVRVAILRKKAAGLQVALPGWIFEYLADRIRNNVRNLEGSLARIAAYQSLIAVNHPEGQREITPETVESLCRDIFQEQVRKVLTIEQIQRHVAEHFDIRVADMTSHRRPANIAFPRQVAMFLAREHTTSSLMNIGEAFGGRDHGTIMHAVKLVKGRMQRDEKTRLAVKMLAAQLQG